MPSHNERIIIECFDNNIYHIYFQNSGIQICGTGIYDVISNIEDYDEKQKICKSDKQ